MNKLILSIFIITFANTINSMETNGNNNNNRQCFNSPLHTNKKISLEFIKNELEDKLHQSFEWFNDINARDKFGWTALLTAVWDENKEITELLIRAGANLNIVNNNFSALIIATQKSNKEIVELLLENGAFIEFQVEGNYYTALIDALLTGNKQIIELLIQYGADLNSTLVSCIFRDNAKRITDLLIQNGANVNTQDKAFGKTALIWAAQYRRKEIVELLIQNEADVNIQDNDGETAFMCLAKGGDYLGRSKQKEIAELLIQKGADLNIQNNDGQTVLDIALQENNKEIVELIKKHANNNHANNNNDYWNPIERPCIIQ